MYNKKIEEHAKTTIQNQIKLCFKTVIQQI